MTLTWLALLAVALSLAWWAGRRAVRYRREAERREAQVLEALFVARQKADGGAVIDVDQIFGVAPASAASTSADAVLRAVGLQAEVVDLVTRPRVERREAVDEAAETPTESARGQEGRSAASPASSPEAEAADTVEFAAGPRVPVRDLVQVFYEARGFRPEPADPSARPVELVLAHKSDGQRAYAFAPLERLPSETALRSIIERARSVGQRRVLIAVEGGGAGASPDSELPAHGVRVLDRAAIESQLERLDAAVADRIRTTAWRRAGQRLRVA